ncbi:hypothetical protein KAT73_03585 [candidate division WOR-3 bacterium]|nr:hypothetical protein [candidate division WOR-3 bacterium]
MKNNMKEYESKNVGVRFIEPAKETDWIPARRLPAGRQGRRESDPYKNQGEASKKYITAFKIIG